MYSKITSKIKLSNLIFISDIDGTLVLPNREKVEKTFELIKTLQTNDIPFGVATALNYEKVLGYINKGWISSPAIIISALGNAIWLQQEDGSYKMDEEYENKISKNFDKGEVIFSCSEFRDKIENEKIKFLPQPQNDQRFKYSLYLKNISDPVYIKKFKKELSNYLNKGKKTYYITISKDIIYDYWNVDITAATKAIAIAYLKKQIEKKAPDLDFQIITAGDSQNDFDILTSNATEFAIVANNSSPDLINEIETYLKKNHFTSQVDFIAEKMYKKNKKTFYLLYKKGSEELRNKTLGSEAIHTVLKENIIYQ